MTDADLLRIAASTARIRSHDPRTQNGAVLARRNDIIVAAANAVPAGLAADAGRLQPPGKYQYIEHAERAVIYRAAWSHWKTGGSTLYCLWFACPDCARAIIQAGIYEVVGHCGPRNATPDRWQDAVQAGERMLREAGVGMRWIAEPLGTSIMFDGRELAL